ncbi:MAG: 50S ribosomal protein L11 methyltransferase [Actinomycetota bacterium]
MTVERPDDEMRVELLIDACWAAGAIGVEDLGDHIRAAFTDEETATGLAAATGGSVGAVEDTSGLDDWRAFAERHDAGPFRIRPPWMAPTDDGIDLCIDPGHAFGSGSHTTTRLVLTALADHVTAGDHVLDLGTGSGVLAVAAARLGATVDAVDVDPAAEPAVLANAEANGVADRVEVRIGDIADLEPTACDVVLLNVTIDVHEQVAAAVRRIDPDRLLIAGILDGEQATRAAELHGREPVAAAVDGEWTVLVFDHGRSARPS